MRLSLTKAAYLLKFGPLGRIVPDLELGRIEQNPQDLWIGRRSPSRKEVEHNKHHNSAEQAPKEIERRRSHDQGQEEELPLNAANRERSVDRFINPVEYRFT